MPNETTEIQALTAKIVTAFVGNHVLAPADLPNVIRSVHGALQKLVNPETVAAPAPAEVPQPAVPIRKSVHPEYIVCLEDGKKLKMLKRHLMTRYGMTPDQYRAKWGLPPEYPMVAPNYAKARSEMAVKFGLGRRAAE